MLIKRITRSNIARQILSRVGSWYIRFVSITTSWQTLGSAIPLNFWNQSKPFILAFWHGRLLMMPRSWESTMPINVLISHHRDGRLLGNTVTHFGIKTISGSSSKGGFGALRAIVKSIKANECIAITPDGPRGPRMRASEGILTISKLTGAPIIPATYSTAKGRLLNSWDKFLLAWPFGTGIIVWGEPIEIPVNATPTELEDARQRLEQSLNALTAKADMLTGREQIEPAPIDTKS